MKICSRCKQPDREFPYTIHGEVGEYVKFKGKIVCYHCWNMLENDRGHYGINYSDNDISSSYSSDIVAGYHPLLQ